jgi:cytochrome c oxidase cbb3-type subunit 4
MEPITAEALQRFAQSWGLLYMFVIFVAVLGVVFSPGAKARAQRAARIILDDDDTLPEGPSRD